MTISTLLRCLTCFSLMLLAPTAELMSFEGFGSATPGGNNGAVVEVTSLQDSGPGTLRAALSGSNRRIVFRVGGTISLQSSLDIRGKSFITIDGSTAPGAGITLQGNGFYIRSSHDVIVTHIRIRDSASDGVTLWDGSYNVIIDHCSITNSADGNIDITENTRDVTVSWSILGDTRSNSFELKTKGMLVTNFNKAAVTNLSLHHNLFINQFQRNPQIATEGLVDIRNNVIRDWGAYGVRMRAGAWGNIINNVFATDNNPEDAVVLELTSGPVYIDGNLGPGARNVDDLTTAAADFTVATVSTDPATEAEEKVLSGAGAFPRDSIDILLAGPADADSCASGASCDPPGTTLPNEEIRFITCSSVNYKTISCPTGISATVVELDEQLSKAACIHGSSWQFTTSEISVTNGCRGVFMAKGLPAGTPPPADAPTSTDPPGTTLPNEEIRFITCSSVDYKTISCPTGISATVVELDEQLSKAACIHGSSWRFTTSEIFVTDGCRAVFLARGITDS